MGCRYNTRLIVTLSVKRLVDVSTDEIIGDFFLPMIETLHVDRVANIRFNVAQILIKLMPRISRDVFAARLLPIITKLQEDPDRDVVFFAGKAQQEAASLFP